MAPRPVKFTSYLANAPRGILVIYYGFEGLESYLIYSLDLMVNGSHHLLFFFFFHARKLNLKLVKYVTSLIIIRTVNLLWLDMNDQRGFGSFAKDLSLPSKILCLVFLLLFTCTA